MILLKPAASWSNEENNFLYTIIKAGGRDALKQLRADVLTRPDVPDVVA